MEIDNGRVVSRSARVFKFLPAEVSLISFHFRCKCRYIARSTLSYVSRRQNKTFFIRENKIFLFTLHGLNINTKRGLAVRVQVM